MMPQRPQEMREEKEEKIDTLVALVYCRKNSFRMIIKQRSEARRAGTRHFILPD